MSVYRHEHDAQFSAIAALIEDSPQFQHWERVSRANSTRAFFPDGVAWKKAILTYFRAERMEDAVLTRALKALQHETRGECPF